MTVTTGQQSAYFIDKVVSCSVIMSLKNQCVLPFQRKLFTGLGSKISRVRIFAPKVLIHDRSFLRKIGGKFQIVWNIAKKFKMVNNLLPHTNL